MAYGLSDDSLPLRSAQATITKGNVARPFGRGWPPGFDAIRRDRTDLGHPDLTIAPPDDSLRHDEARPTSRVRRIKQEAAVRHQAPAVGWPSSAVTST